MEFHLQHSINIVRTLLISDIHANLSAFEAVLEDAVPFDQVWCLGDLVGYGPDPEECVKLLRSLPGLQCIMGNHDAAILGFIDFMAFNDEARYSLQIQLQHLSQESMDFLELLPIRLEVEGVTLAHGSPRNPIWEYVLRDSVARDNFEHFDTQGCLIGHSHVPLIFSQDEQMRLKLLQPQNADRWLAKERFILNPGSLGQPRDLNPEASYVVWDDQENTWEFRRAAYDIFGVQARMEALNLPMRNIHRLAHGM